MTESLLWNDLSNTQTAMIARCAERQQALRVRPTFCRVTALGLLAVECPKITTMAEHHRIQGMHDVMWSGYVQRTVIAGKVMCTTAECTWVMMAPLLSDAELVVLGDNMMRRDPQLKRTTKDQMEQYLDFLTEWAREQEGGKRIKGLARCKRLCTLLAEDTDSSMETRLRLVLMVYGLGEPVVNLKVVDPDTGAVMYLDLSYPGVRIAIEYEGAHHAVRWANDAQRRRRLEYMGWEVIQVTAADMGTVERQRALAMLVAERIGVRIGRKVRICERMAVRDLTDGRRMRKHRDW